MKATWVNQHQLLEAERAVATRTGDVLKCLDPRWVATIVDSDQPGTVMLDTAFAGEQGPVLHIEVSTLPEYLANSLHEHFVQPVREAARQRRVAKTDHNLAEDHMPVTADAARH